MIANPLALIAELTHRCPLHCVYCSNPLELTRREKELGEDTWARVLGEAAALGVLQVDFTGGEPLARPDLTELIRTARAQGLYASLITSGLPLDEKRLDALVSAGLDHLQISIDNVKPDKISLKSLKVLDRKLESLAEHACFRVNINSVVGTSEHPEDAVAVARRARELGFQTTVGIVHDGQGQLQPLGQAAQRVYREIMQISSRGFSTFAYYNQFQKNLVEGKTNNWRCRAGSRYLYVCEDGLVHYCSQQRGAPGIPLENYSAENLEREYDSVKSCAPFCTVSCVHQVSMIDQFRDQPKQALAQFFPARSGQEDAYDPPASIGILTWMFLPPEENRVRKKLTQGLTRAASWCLRVR